MKSPHKVAFLATFSSACIHRRMRGALSYADLRSHIIIRDFRIPLEMGIRDANDAEMTSLNAWKPDGILSFLDDRDLESVLDRLDRVVPIVSMAAVKPRPGLVLVGGSMPRMIAMAVNHFRQQGLRSLGMVTLDHDPAVQQRCARIFAEISQSDDPGKVIHHEAVPAELLADLEHPVTPIPQGLARWLRDLPKPAGVMTVDYRGGNFLVRVCHSLGLRVPDDVSVICVDDVDLCLSSTPTLTSVEAASELIGFEAMKTLDGMLQGHPPPEAMIRVEAVDLHVRQSTGGKSAEVCDIASAVNHINLYACQGLTVERLIQETQLVSKMTFHKHFTAAIGRTPGEAIRERQFAEARRLLAETKLSITRVAEQSGFGSSSDFARAFRNAEGMTPRDYRNANHRD